MELVAVSKKKYSQLEVVEDLKYKVENLKAVYEIARIVCGTKYSMKDVWREIAEDELLRKKAESTP